MRVRSFAAFALIYATAAIGCGGASATESAPQVEPAVQTSVARMQVTAACGGTGQSDCPLQHWMKATLQSYQKANNYDRLARSFDDLAQHAPASYARWADLATEGAAAARKQDVAAVRAACKTCHDEHRARYRRERRADPFM